MTFIEHLQTASMERIHSALIAWLFSVDCDAILIADKYILLKSIFDISTVCKNTQIKTHIEYEHIDIILEFEDTIIAIENKIKISEHSNQLATYNAILNKRFNGKRIYKYYLSLIGEETSDLEWKSLSYTKFFTELSNICIAPVKSASILSDYIDTLRHLTECVDLFSRKPNSMPVVFTNGSIKIQEKKQLPPFHDSIQQYISDNNLETVLQRLYFLIIKRSLKSSLPELAVVGETRGKGLLDIKFTDQAKFVNYKLYKIAIGIQFQDGTVKIQFENGYNEDGTVRDAQAGLEFAIQEIISHLRIIPLQFIGNKWKLNSPKSANSAYFSLSRKLCGFKGVYYLLPLEKAMQVYKNEYSNALEATNEVIKLIEAL